MFFFGAVVTGIVEDADALWISCLAVAVILVVLAGVASVLACRSEIRRARGEQSQSGRQQETPPGDVAAHYA